MSTEIRYFRGQGLRPDDELSADAARARAHVQALFRDGRPVRAEVRTSAGVELVLYFDRPDVDDELLSRHRRQYACSLRTVARSREDEARWRVRWSSYTPHGQSLGRLEQVEDDRQRVLAEFHYDADGRLVEQLEHEYDGDVLLRSYVVAPDGTRLLEPADEALDD